MASLDYNTLPIEEKALHTPPLEELVEVLSRGLRRYFEEVEVAVAEPPDLTQPPFLLSAPGLCGDPKLVEVGGPPYLVPAVRRDKVYDLAALAHHLRRDPALLLGAGAGPWPYLGVNCEGMVNLGISGGAVEQGSRVAWVEPRGAARGAGGWRTRRLPPDETRSALLGNYLVCAGSRGPALRVAARARTTDANFVTAIRETLKEHYGDKVVGLGGAFVLHEGRVRYHVMPDFSPTPLCSDAAVDGWLHYFEMRAPLVHLGTLVTGDLGLDLRVQHFHGWGAHGDGGHYHGDTTPAAARYEGYFARAAAVVRVDRPRHTHQLGRD